MTLTTAGLIWLITGVACFLLEMALPGFVIFFFGVGAWVTVIACWFTPIGLNGQLLLFLVSSLLTLFTLRGFIKKTFLGDVTDDEGEVSVTAGDQAEVVADIIPPAPGRILYSGTQWNAIAEEPIAKGSIVTIVTQDGLNMKVAKVS